MKEDSEKKGEAKRMPELMSPVACQESPQTIPSCRALSFLQQSGLEANADRRTKV
jgi:hypothetical protein